MLVGAIRTFSLVKSLVELGPRSFFQGFLGEAAIQNLDGVEFFSFLYRFLLPLQEGLESKHRSLQCDVVPWLRSEGGEKGNRHTIMTIVTL